MDSERVAQRAAAGRASGEARRARIRERDRAMALERARRPGRSYARIGAPHGLTRDGTRKAVLRAMADPANREAVEAADRERREFLARFAEGGAAPARRPDPTAAAVDCPECPAGMAAARGGAK